MEDQEIIKRMREQFGFYDQPRRFSREQLSAKVKDGDFLASIDCSGMDLGGADLTGCIFEKVSFNGANLRGADLRESVFAKADFGGADLQGARMNQAVFQEADLSKANLQDASLGYAKLLESRAEQIDMARFALFILQR